MTDKNNRPFISGSWSKEIEDKLISDGAFLFTPPMEMHTPRKRKMKEKVYLRISKSAMKVYTWSQAKYLNYYK